MLSVYVYWICGVVYIACGCVYIYLSYKHVKAIKDYCKKARELDAERERVLQYIHTGKIKFGDLL